MWKLKAKIVLIEAPLNQKSGSSQASGRGREVEDGSYYPQEVRREFFKYFYTMWKIFKIFRFKLCRNGSNQE